MAKRVGIDPATEEAVEFDLTNPDFVSAYFDMHHRMEAEGVDFWWLDWQQGGVTRQPGLDPLWVLNHLHYLDSGRYETSSERNVNENCECEKCAEPGARDEHEMHVEQSKRNVSCTERNNRWPLTFSRYAGPGSHRYPVGFSGDTIVTNIWKPVGTSLARSARSIAYIPAIRSSWVRNRGIFPRKCAIPW